MRPDKNIMSRIISVIAAAMLLTACAHGNIADETSLSPETSALSESVPAAEFSETEVSSSVITSVSGQIITSETSAADTGSDGEIPENADISGVNGTSDNSAQTTDVSYEETDNTPETPLPLYRSSFSAEDAYVKPLGRTLMRNGVRILSHTCSGVEFSFRGTSADITLTSSFNSFKARAAVYVNGNIVTDTLLNNKEETFHVFESEETQDCVISVVKLSESSYSDIGVKSISVNSEKGIAPTPEKKHRIEFIGDSITSGYGNEAADQYEDFSTANENGERSYAALTGKYFNAEYNILSWSGIGVYSSYTESSEPDQSYIMPLIYGKTAVNESDEEWDFSVWQPDLIVINLGTNDNVWTKGIDERVDRFGSAYYDFIKQVRAANPNAYIICSLGVLGNDLFPEIEKQVRSYSEDTGDDRIAAFEFDMQDGQADGFGSGYHPSAKTHQKMADKLIPFISEVMGW